MIAIRTIMIFFILTINYFVFRINDQTHRTPGALGGGLYILGCFAISIIVSISIAYGFQKLYEIRSCVVRFMHAVEFGIAVVAPKILQLNFRCKTSILATSEHAKTSQQKI